MAQLNGEPSMEDILASIKQIIADDVEVAPRSARPRRETAPTATPSSKAPDPVMQRVAAPAEPIEREAGLVDPAEVYAVEIDDSRAAPKSSMAAPMFNQKRAEAPMSPVNLISDTAAQASRNAFAGLSQMQVRAEAGQENSLEGVVVDLLRPMLSEWLDRELPAMVERLVSEEVARLSGRG